MKPSRFHTSSRGADHRSHETSGLSRCIAPKAHRLRHNVSAVLDGLRDEDLPRAVDAVRRLQERLRDLQLLPLGLVLRDDVTGATTGEGDHSRPGARQARPMRAGIQRSADQRHEVRVHGRALRLVEGVLARGCKQAL